MHTPLILNVHNILGAILVLSSLAAIFWQPARRYILYVLVLQIVLGAATWGITKYPPPTIHWVLAILNGGTYAMATAFERKGRPRALILGALVLGFAIFAYVAIVGTIAYKAMAPAA
ncbi:MAG: hypothetical protein NVS2B3_15540 [Vulcanimicrobiaceae bacterium]